MTPALPETRDERIALARSTIERCLGLLDQLEEGHQRDFRDAGMVVFQVLVPSFHLGVVLNSEVSIALVQRAGFERVEMTSPLRALQGDECRLYFRVPVGAP